LASEIRYAKSGDIFVAYQVLGSGERNIVFVPGFFSNIDHDQEEPGFSILFEGLSELGRLVIFDKRGTGLSDRVERAPTMEERMDDLRVVMDAAGMDRATIFGISEGGALAILFAASHPERCSGLALFGAFPKFSYWFPSEDRVSAFYSYVKSGWGTGANVSLFAPSKKDDASFRNWWAKRERLGASPSSAAAMMTINRQIDVSGILSSVSIPTLLMHRKGDVVVDIAAAYELARGIPNAKLVELEGTDHLPNGSGVGVLLEHLSEFVTGTKCEPFVDRVLTTILMTDIVGSTRIADMVGDARWKFLIEQHNAITRQELKRYRGTEIKSLGDGFLCTFDGPARAVLCAQSIIRQMRSNALEIRAGIHTGEAEFHDNDIRGLAVHVASRVMGTADASQCVVSRTVKDLVAGAGISFEDYGPHQLKGISEPINLFLATI
jgi:class 3 adenylate cyclase/alpha-beta hydrolase superfamily lysophospholipase